MDIGKRVLKESNKSRVDGYSVRNSVLIISHITFRDCRVPGWHMRVHSFSDNLSRNSCIQLSLNTPPFLQINVKRFRAHRRLITSKPQDGFNENFKMVSMETFKT